MKYYLAGPMSGKPQFNYPLFDEVANGLRANGLDIVSPAEMDDEDVRANAMANMTGEMAEVNEVSSETWGDFLARDVKLIADELNAIILLPEWDTSRGARLEAFVALNCDYPCFTVEPSTLRMIPRSTAYVMEKINDNLF